MSTVLLTRVECLCGTTAAIPEAGFFPLCGHCGRRMIAPDEGRVNYVSEPLELDEAVRRHVAAWPTPPVRPPGHSRRYTDEQLRAVLQARGWPIEAQPWPSYLSPDCDPGQEHYYTAPPWEPAPAWAPENAR